MKRKLWHCEFEGCRRGARWFVSFSSIEMEPGILDSIQACHRHKRRARRQIGREFQDPRTYEIVARRLVQNSC